MQASPLVVAMGIQMQHAFHLFSLLPRLQSDIIIKLKMLLIARAITVANVTNTVPALKFSRKQHSFSDASFG